MQRKQGFSSRGGLPVWSLEDAPLCDRSLQRDVKLRFSKSYVCFISAGCCSFFGFFFRNPCGPHRHSLKAPSTFKMNGIDNCVFAAVLDLVWMQPNTSLTPPSLSFMVGSGCDVKSILFVQLKAVLTFGELSVLEGVDLTLLKPYLPICGLHYWLFTHHVV